MQKPKVVLQGGAHRQQQSEQRGTKVPTQDRQDQGQEYIPWPVHGQKHYQYQEYPTAKQQNEFQGIGKPRTQQQQTAYNHCNQYHPVMGEDYRG